MLALPPYEPPAPGWWTVLSYNRTVDRGRADRQAREQERRRNQNRRRVQRISEAMCLVEAAPPAYRVEGVRRAGQHLSRYGVESRSRSAGPDHEPFVGRPVSPCELYLRGEI